MCPLVGPHQPGNHIKRGALARSVRPEKPGQVAGFNLQGKMVHRLNAAKSLGDVFQNQCWRRFHHGFLPFAWRDGDMKMERLGLSHSCQMISDNPSPFRSWISI